MIRSVRLIAAASVLGVLSLATPGVASADQLPYADPSVRGGIGLCDRNLRPVTTGHITDKPFVWRAVSSVAAPTAYTGSGRKATLLAYQPRPGTPADQWSGDSLTATGSYSNPSVPMAQATPLDFTLKDYLEEFPPQLNGLVQLRMFFSAPGVGVLNATYSAADLRISGDTWTLLDGASVSCTSGQAASSETAKGASPGALAGAAGGVSGSGTAHSGPAAAGTPGASGSNGSRPGTAGPAVPQPGTADPRALDASVGGRPVGSNRHGALIIGSAVAAALAACAGGIAWARRRRGA